MGGRLIVTKNTSPVSWGEEAAAAAGSGPGRWGPLRVCGAGGRGLAGWGGGGRRGACSRLSLSPPSARVSPTNARVPGCVCHVVVPQSSSCVCDCEILGVAT